MLLATAPIQLPSLPAALSASGFQQIEAGPAGGSVWQGVIPSTATGRGRRPSAIYVPPADPPGGRFPVVYLLHGLPGSPYSYVYGLRFAKVADALVSAHAVPPFVAVMPAAGETGHFHGEWVGRWERDVADDVVPWVDANLPAETGRRGRVLAGYSAGGYGAVDIGLRHPGLFGTLEAWSGYFRPIRDGALRHAGPAELAAHDPTLLARREAPLLRRLDTRFFLSCGATRDHVTAGFARVFADELRALGLTNRLWLRPGGHNGKFWLAQMPAALRYGLSRQPSESPRRAGAPTGRARLASARGGSGFRGGRAPPRT